MNKTPRLTILSELHGRVILHEARLFKICVDSKVVKKIIVEHTPTLFQSFVKGQQPVTREEEVEDVDQIWLLDFSGAKRQKSFSSDKFCERVLKLGSPSYLSVYTVRNKLSEYTMLKFDMAKLYDLQIKEDHNKTRNL